MNARHLIVGFFLASCFSTAASAQKTIPRPAFKPGETFFYLVHLKSNRDIKTKSALSLPQQPVAATIGVSGILQVEVLSSESPAAGTRLRTWFLNLAGDVEGPSRATTADPVPSPEKNTGGGKFVDCTLQSDGQITQIANLEQLAPEQQTAWREWAARFGAVFLFESQLRRRGEKWSLENPENSPSPVAELLWQQKVQYAKDENCAPQRFAHGGSFERSATQESCAVILSTAALLQKSSPQDSTPQDYRLKGLRTRGTARGNNDTIFYISRKTGRLIRATQNAKQQMDVTISLSDGRALHYAIRAEASSSVELVTDLPLILQPKSGG